MYKILLVCSAGMSTSLLISKMKKEAIAQRLEVEIQGMSMSEAEIMYGDWDIVLLGPQIRYVYKKFSELGKSKGIPVLVIDMHMYGMMDGKGVFNQALKLLQDAEK